MHVVVVVVVVVVCIRLWSFLFTGFRLYSVFSPEEMKLLGEEPLTFNNHRKAITVETFHSRPELSGFFSMLSSNRDRQGVEFVSSMEG